MLVALTGGVGGAKLVRGLYLTGRPLCAVVNTADDFEHLGLTICPDLDSVMYALADLSDPERGWGVRGESWSALQMLSGYGAPAWFQLGDRDLATHILRTQGLKQGQSLTRTTAQLCKALGLRGLVLPMSDDAVRTQVHTATGWLDFQVYFVKERCAPTVDAVRFLGIERAKPTSDALDALARARLVVLCPSNPLVSVDPILCLPGMRDALKAAACPVVAVSPLIQGKAVKGPTVEMLRGLEIDPSPVAVAGRYADVLDGFVLDGLDRALREPVAALGLEVLVTDTLMKTDRDKRRLADAIVNAWL